MYTDWTKKYLTKLNYYKFNYIATGPKYITLSIIQFEISEVCRPQKEVVKCPSNTSDEINRAVNYILTGPNMLLQIQLYCTWSKNDILTISE